MGQGALNGARGTRQLSVPFRFTVSAKQTINEERLERLIVMVTAGKLDTTMYLDQCITCVTLRTIWEGSELTLFSDRPGSDNIRNCMTEA